MKGSKHTVMHPEEALSLVTSGDGTAIYASSDIHFKGAVFGRDSLEVIEDLLQVKPGLAKPVLLGLASLQGLKTDRINEEEPGKIHHEYRSLKVDGKKISSTSLKIFGDLTSKWGRYGDEMIYYGSVDSTPLFIKILCSYVQIHGPSILDEQLKRKDGKVITFADSLEAAINWLINKLNESPSGLLGFQALNPEGISNQAWKDSNEFYVHTDGVSANHEHPIISVEVQGIAYDALMFASTLLPNRSKELQKLAKHVQEQTIEKLWIEDKGYFALGLDQDENGRLRRIETPTANPAGLLDTTIFDNLPSSEREKYISAIARTIFSPDFLTNAGFRSRSLKYANIVPFWDYHGSLTVWLKEVYDIAKGLRKQGFLKLAEQAENRLLNTVYADGNYPEFVYVDAKGRVLHGPPSDKEMPNVIDVHGTNHPEAMQAWTISAVLAIEKSPRANKINRSQDWSTHLETEILENIPIVTDLRKSKDEIRSKYPTHAYRVIPSPAFA